METLAFTRKILDPSQVFLSDSILVYVQPNSYRRVHFKIISTKLVALASPKSGLAVGVGAPGYEFIKFSP